MNAVHQEYNANLFLKSIFLERIKRNSKYSMRSFARDLGLSPAHISLVFNNKRQLNLSAIQKIVAQGKLNVEQIDSIYRFIEYTQTNNTNEKSEILAKIKKKFLNNLNMLLIESEKFSMISEWYGFAIIELTRTKNPPSSIIEISNRLGITEGFG